MELKPDRNEKIGQLLKKGVRIQNTFSVDIGNEVNTEHISGEGVILYPGVRIYGAKTVISSGAQLGYEAPVTVDDCQVGPKVELKGGYFNKAVFLEKSKMGPGAQVREGCILEEEAGGAHCVGLKQTILFPFVTLGSLINFCDCLLAGGTSRKNHSEVGSSYIHFNYTPDGNKSTSSLLGDVPRGVMLNQPPIFLGGQGGIVGPVILGYGNVVAAGSVLRNDCLEDNQLIIPGPVPSAVKKFIPNSYGNLKRIISNNIAYIANLYALEQWYINIRKPFLIKQEFGNLIFEGLIEKLSMAREERLSRLKILVDKVPPDSAERKELKDNIGSIIGILGLPKTPPKINEDKKIFIDLFEKAAGNKTTDYIKTIQGLPPEVSAKGTKWLKGIVDGISAQVSTRLKLLNI